MKTTTQYIKKLIHFDESGTFFSKENVRLVLDEQGMVVELVENQNDFNSSQQAKPHLLGLPCFVDAHTHTLFAGNRSHEFQMKSQGKTYLEIAKEGGGILHTQSATKNSSDEELTALTLMRLEKFRNQGVFGVEIKTGYGLEHDEEIRHLRILQKIKTQVAPLMKLWITYMGPHAVLKGVDKKQYLDEICNRTLPLIAKENLCDFVDIFVDDGFFSSKDMDQYCEVAKGLGLKMKAHIDEIKNLDASHVAVKHKIVSVDHCRHTTQPQMKELSGAGVQIVMLPATSFYIEEGFLPMEHFRQIKVLPALASDYNPGSQPSLSWPFLLHLGMKKMGMSEAELLEAVTLTPLKALDEDPAMWCLQVGKKCKLNLFEAEKVSELAYRFGENLFARGLIYL